MYPEEIQVYLKIVSNDLFELERDHLYAVFKCMLEKLNYVGKFNSLKIQPMDLSIFLQEGMNEVFDLSLCSHKFESRRGQKEAPHTYLHTPYCNKPKECPFSNWWTLCSIWWWFMVWATHYNGKHCAPGSSGTPEAKWSYRKTMPNKTSYSAFVILKFHKRRLAACTSSKRIGGSLIPEQQLHQLSSDDLSPRNINLKIHI